MSITKDKDTDEVLITLPLSEFNSLQYYTLLLVSGKRLNQFERKNAMTIYTRIETDKQHSMELYKAIFE